MEKRIELERRARKPNQITELNLDNCRSTSIVGLTDEYTALETLSLINVGLTTLKGFPKLPNLRKLELSDNRISNGLNYLHTSPKLQYLYLCGNKIKDLEALKPLEEFKHLTILDLFNNEATQIENYREKIFEMLPTLKFLDGFDCNDVEAPSEEDNQNVFSLNGLEIDLDELEEFEKRVKAKREAKLKQQHDDIVSQSSDCTLNTTDKNVAVNSDVDELDEYLKTLKLKNQQNELEKSANIETANSNNCETHTAANFVLLLYWFLAILNFASATFNNSNSEDEEEIESDLYFGSSGEENDDDEDDEDDEDNDISLSEVYNDDLTEEDSGDWEEENAAENIEDDDDEDSDEDEPKKSAVANTDKDADGDANAEETEARGKKRKHEG